MKLLTEKNSKRLLWIGLLLFIVGFLFFLWNDWNFSTTNKIDSTKFGELGDYIGGLVGSLWSLAGVIMFYVALTEQRKDIKTNQDTLNTQVEALKQQIKEFELQRQELEETRKVFKEQNKTQHYQRFDNTFFELLRTHNDIVESIDLRSTEEGNVVAAGRDCFRIFYIRFKNSVKLSYDFDMDSTMEGYKKFFINHQSELGHYFRMLYHIIKFIDASEINDKKRYTNFVRAQLSSYELVLLFYNGLSKFGREKFKPLIENYSLLKNMDESLVISYSHLSEYKTNAYN